MEFLKRLCLTTLLTGLAFAGVHDPDGKGIFPPSSFNSGTQASEEQVTQLLSSLAPNKREVHGAGKDTHVFDVIARILKDDRLHVVCRMCTECWKGVQASGQPLRTCYL